MSLWCARLTWVLLPLTAGGAIGDSLAGWSTAPARLAAALAWLAWTIGLVALLAPRTWGLTALRVVAPAATVVAIAASTSATVSGVAAVLAIASTVVATGFALSAPVAQAAANADAYGDEVRFPLRVPTPLLFGPVPLSVVLVGLGVSAGPLLLADGRYVAGAILSVLGIAIALVLLRSLHGLSTRWLVVVPAGVVVVDPFTLADPILMRREHVTSLAREPIGHTGLGVIDLRLGTRGGSIEIALDAPQPFPRRRGRHGMEIRDADLVQVAAVRSKALVALTADRRIGASAA